MTTERICKNCRKFRRVWKRTSFWCKKFHENVIFGPKEPNCFDRKKIRKDVK